MYYLIFPNRAFSAVLALMTILMIASGYKTEAATLTVGSGMQHSTIAAAITASVAGPMTKLSR
jgi:hypothetical protein